MDISLTDLEQAINFWRNRYPSTGEEQKLCPQANALAEPYADMIMQRLKQVDEGRLSAAAQLALADWWQFKLAAAAIKG